MLRAFSNIVQTARSSLPLINPVRGKKKQKKHMRLAVTKITANNYRRQAQRIQYYDRLQLESIGGSDLLPKAMREQALVDLNAMPKSSDPTRPTDRCQLTGGVKYLVEDYKVNRIIFRNNAHDGQIAGLKFWMYPNYSNYDIKKQVRRLAVCQHDRYYQKWLATEIKKDHRYRKWYKEIKEEMSAGTEKDWPEHMRKYMSEDPDPLIYY